MPQNAIPTDGVDDSRPPEQLEEEGAGDPWGDAATGDDGLIPGRDFDPADDPDAGQDELIEDADV